MNDSLKRVTPQDATDFEREQLRFFLSSADMADTLTEINPSLAWLPILAELNLLQNDAALPLWVERNFSSAQAVAEVVENIRFFRSESANILEYRLNGQRDRLDPLLTKCWQLIIRHIRNRQQGLFQHRWFLELLPRLKKADLSANALQGVGEVLTPKLFVEKRFVLHDELPRKIAKPTDLMSVRYRVDEGVGANDFLAAWPKNATAVAEEQLLQILTNSLEIVLADAVELGVESNDSLSISDIDVPSIAAHEQNSYRAGFQPIVRVTAELWSQLAKKSLPKSRDIFDEWRRSGYRLIRRLSLFAATDSKISAYLAADVLIHLPRDELFFTNSRVEVHRLIRSRWKEFPLSRRRQIEKRIVEGPSADRFQGNKDRDAIIDRCRFDLLVELERVTLPMSRQASAVLKDIRKRRPEWRGAEPERVGFAVWQGSVTGVIGSKEKLVSIPDDQLITVAKEVARRAEFMEGDAWQALCQDDPAKAFRGIEQASVSDRWHDWLWRPLLWSANKITEPRELNRIADVLSQWPETQPFDETAPGAAWWIDQVSDKLKAKQLWAVWDLIERRASHHPKILNDDPFGTSLNDVAGHLASVLLKRTPVRRDGHELGTQLRARYEKLISPAGVFGLLARVRLAVAISFLFERAPKWTTTHILPSFKWNSQDAPSMWSARKYSPHIGSDELFKLTKDSFLELFSRSGTPDDDLRTFSGWLAAILLANQANKTTYSLTASEVRSVLRRAEGSALSSFAHRLAHELQKAQSEQRPEVWKNIVGVVFQSAWPLDIELQTAEATYQLVQMLLATGSAFGEAATVIIPFIRPEASRHHTSIYSISEANEELYRIAPQKMLDLISAAVGDASDRSVVGLHKALTKLEREAPQFVHLRQFQTLMAQASQY